MCKLCETYDFTRIGVGDWFANNDRPHIYFAGGSGIVPNDQRFRYCPMCGKQIIYKEDGENDNAAMV